MKKLTGLHIHPRDSRIQFIADTHQYIIDNTKFDFISVTTFIKQFFHPFEPSVYIQDLISKNIFMKKYPNHTPDSLQMEWKEIGMDASSLGTQLHEMIEFFYNEDIITQDICKIEKEWNFFLHFQKDFSYLHPYRTEWYIFSERFKIAGSIDMVFKDDMNKYHIYDWKRSKTIKYKNYYQKGKIPINSLDDCNYNHYSLQLNLYKYILKHCYQLDVQTMYLVILHPNNDSYKAIEVKDMQKEIKEMLKYRFTNQDLENKKVT